MARIGLCGPCYTSQSPAADPEDLFNWYVEQVESPSGRSAFVLYPCAGLAVYVTLADSPYRGGITVNVSGFPQRAFAVGGSTLFEITGGVVVNRGAVVNDGLPASFAYNQASQLMVTSGGTVYCFNLSTNGFAAVGGLSGPVSQILFNNGYFNAILTGTNKFQVSLLEDGTTWTGIGPTTNSIQKFADAIVGGMVEHNELWFFSAKNGIGYYDSGSNNIFDPIGDSAFTEDGLGSGSAMVKADNTFFYLNASERGGGILKRLNGNIPVRVSNHAVEYQWSTYPTIADAQMFAFEDQGHTFIQIRFPSANGGLGATWVYDVTTGLFHKRAYWDAVNGRYKAHLAQGHMFYAGQHLVGDWSSGKIYTQSIQNLDDAGNPIRRMRISPIVEYQNERVSHQRLQIGVEPGLGLNAGQGSDPQIALSWSNTFGKTWSNEYSISAGKQGEYLKRLRWQRLGTAYQRCYKIVTTDPTPWRIVSDDLRATPGFGPSERLSTQALKSA